MSFNIFPKNVFKGTNSDGTRFTANEYSFDTILNLGMINTLLTFGFIALFFGFGSLVLLILGLFIYKGGSKWLFITTLILSFYFVVDATRGWFMLFILQFLFSENSLAIMVGINMGVMVCSLIMVCFGKGIKELALSFDFMYPLIILIGFFLGYTLGRPTTQGWVKEKVGFHRDTTQKVDETRGMDNRQLEEYYDKQYEDELKSQGRDIKDVERYAN